MQSSQRAGKSSGPKKINGSSFLAKVYRDPAKLIEFRTILRSGKEGLIVVDGRKYRINARA